MKPVLLLVTYTAKPGMRESFGETLSGKLQELEDLMLDTLVVEADTTDFEAPSMMLASALILTFQNVQTTLGKGILRGGGDTKFLMVLDVILQWCTSIPLGYLVGIVFQASAFVVLITVKIDFVIKSLLFLRRMLSDKWMHSVKRQSPAA